MPTRRRQRLSRFFPVMREEGGLLVELLGMRRFDRPGHRRMRAPPALLQLRAQRHLLRERVLEREFGYRIERLLVHELVGLERRQRRTDLALRQLGGGEE